MKEAALKELLATASDKQDDNTFVFLDTQEAALLVLMDETLLTVTRVRKVVLGKLIVAIEADRETLYVETSAVTGVRLKASPEGTGFIKK